MAYVQKGLRWIPSYKVTIGTTGKARVQLQATLVNELADLDDVTANLVVGVPTFAFKGMVDPMALQQTVAQLGEYFDARSASGLAMSNAIMAQVGARADGRFRDEERANQPPDLGPEVTGSEPDQDLYVFTVKRVTLKKGERMVLPVAEYELGYRDVYVMDLPFAPPMEVRANVNDDQQRQLARLLGAPHFMHVLRLTNSGHEPLTTAPALISSGDRVLGQGMMSYTAPGAECDLELTTAVDIKVAKTDKETGRTPGALTVDGSTYLRVDLNGSIAITNRRDQAVDIEVTRSVLGTRRWRVRRQGRDGECLRGRRRRSAATLVGMVRLARLVGRGERGGTVHLEDESRARQEDHAHLQVALLLEMSAQRCRENGSRERQPPPPVLAAGGGRRSRGCPRLYTVARTAP